ncbi:hypothetical protein GLOIN_2v1768212 [Rhizophagus irregularis DAOM 181602=DAOM 197198]|nr:hypothetical protein GLOIN_2v1768212 [Rhizophagus irregularis DAOM 181602=DAOM 197198]
MACLKIFSGDLPELTNEIIKYFHDDYITLHSCILVNRLWCRLAIPLLWENPFSIHFIQHLDTSNIISSIESWGAAVRTSTTQISNLIKFIYRSLFQIFIENEVNLHSLEVVSSSSQESKYFDDILKLNPNFFRNIKILNLEDSFITAETLTKFQHCSTLIAIQFHHFILNSHYVTTITMTIQRSKKVYHKLLILKKILERFYLALVDFLYTKFIPQIINITKPFKLKSLILNEILQIESLLLLIQKFGNNIEDFGFKIGINVSQQLLQLLESVVIYCSKIKILYLPSGLNSQNINSLINLIENIKQNLNYLLIDTNDNHLSSIILQNLGQILPFKLEYLYLSLITNRSDLEAFLKNSQNTFIKILVIKNTTKYESEDIFPYIEEYIIKKKRIKYLAILQTFLTSFLTAPRKNLFDLKDKVDYYKLYDIQVLDCYSSSINIEKFIL